MQLKPIKGIAEYHSLEQGQQLIKSIRNVVVFVERERLKPVIWESIKDVLPSSWCVEGQTTTKNQIHKAIQTNNLSRGVS